MSSFLPLLFPLLLLLSFLSSSFLPFISAATCSPSLTTICVSHDGTQFLLQGGVFNHSAISSPTPRASLDLIQGQLYVFELTEIGDFSSHPFVLTSDPVGGCSSSCPYPGVSLLEEGETQPATSAISANANGLFLAFTATNEEDVGKGFYYQCENHEGMGGNITIVNGNYTIGNTDGWNVTYPSSVTTNGMNETTIVNQTQVVYGTNESSSSTGFNVEAYNGTNPLLNMSMSSTGGDGGFGGGNSNETGFGGLDSSSSGAGSSGSNIGTGSAGGGGGGGAGGILPGGVGNTGSAGIGSGTGTGGAGTGTGTGTGGSGSGSGTGTGNSGGGGTTGGSSKNAGTKQTGAMGWMWMVIATVITATATKVV